MIGKILFSDVAYVVISAIGKKFYFKSVVCASTGVGKGEMNGYRITGFFCGNIFNIGVFFGRRNSIGIIAAGFGIVKFTSLKIFSGNTEIFGYFAFEEICGICVNFGFKTGGSDFYFIGVFGSGNDPGVIAVGFHCGAIFDSFGKIIEAAFSGNNDGTVKFAGSAEINKHFFVKSNVFFGDGFFLCACCKRKHKHCGNDKSNKSFHIKFLSL